MNDLSVEVIRSPRGGYWHYGLLFRFAGGGHAVYHNAKGRGVVCDPIEAFGAGRGWAPSGDPIPLLPAEVLRRAGGALGSPYALVRFNCDHFWRWATGNAPFSPQIERIMLAALVTGVVSRALDADKAPRTRRHASRRRRALRHRDVG